MPGREGDIYKSIQWNKGPWNSPIFELSGQLNSMETCHFCEKWNPADVIARYNQFTAYHEGKEPYSPGKRLVVFFFWRKKKKKNNLKVTFCTYRLKVRKWETTFHAKENQRWNNTRIEKMNFKIKTYKIQRRILPNDQVQFSCSVVSDSLWPPRTAAQQTSLSITISQSLLKLMPIESVMSSNYLILCHPLLLLSSIFPSITVFSKESVLHIRWPKYWSFSFNISPSNEHPGLISFRMDWLDLLAVYGTLESLLQHHSSKASILRCSAFFIVQLSHPSMTTGKTIALTN